MKETISIAITLFFIMDPLGNIPLFITELYKVEPKRRKAILVRELFIALIVLLCFFFLGDYFLKALHLSPESIRIGGGIILFLIALRMIFPQDKNVIENQKIKAEEPFIVPLAIPLVAGPSALAVVLLLNNSQPKILITNLIALLIAWTANSIILYFSTNLFKILKKRGLIALERLMGMLLVIMSVQMLLDGVYNYFTTFHIK
jgi:multiple antibiotic resistance protein